MKSFLLPISLLFIYVTAASAAASAWYSEDPDHPGKCVFHQPDFILSPGEQVPDPARCGVFMCGDKALAQKYSCGVATARENCKVKEPLDASAPYPDCCPQGIICNDVSKVSTEYLPAALV